MKDYLILGLVVGFGIGLATGAGLGERRGANPAKVINWEPANRYEMHVDDQLGTVWRLDRATGVIHVSGIGGSFDLPEYENDHIAARP